MCKGWGPKGQSVQNMQTLGGKWCKGCKRWEAKAKGAKHAKGTNDGEKEVQRVQMRTKGCKTYKRCKLWRQRAVKHVKCANYGTKGCKACKRSTLWGQMSVT